MTTEGAFTGFRLLAIIWVAAGFSLRLHRLESLCYQLFAKWYKGGQGGINKRLIIPLNPPLEKGDLKFRFPTFT
jgi:hypothetical protein